MVNLSGLVLRETMVHVSGANVVIPQLQYARIRPPTPRVSAGRKFIRVRPIRLGKRGRAKAIPKVKPKKEPKLKTKPRKVPKKKRKKATIGVPTDIVGRTIPGGLIEKGWWTKEAATERMREAQEQSFQMWKWIYESSGEHPWVKGIIQLLTSSNTPVGRRIQTELLGAETTMSVSDYLVRVIERWQLQWIMEQRRAGTGAETGLAWTEELAKPGWEIIRDVIWGTGKTLEEQQEEAHKALEEDEARGFIPAEGYGQKGEGFLA